MMFLSIEFVVVYFLFFLIQSTESINCPSSYNTILNGCYKVNNGSNLTWTDAQQYCFNESTRINVNRTGPVTHLLALESTIETTSLLYWMKAWGIQGQFWTDGVENTSVWFWSQQTITWYFSSTDQIISGNGTNFRLIYNNNRSTYQVFDDLSSRLSNFICEYQDICNTTNSCQNGATCYLNVGRELCVCAPGFTGTQCDQEIDECLSSPCQHGGNCTDAVNNYTCDCSNIFFSGANCEIANADPTASQRSAAFWSVFGVVCSLVGLLTISDLPWSDIANNLGCPWFQWKSCSKINDDEEDELNTNNIPLSESPTVDNPNQVTVSKTAARGVNYHVMNTVWNPEQIRGELSSTAQYNGYRSPDQHTTPDNVLIQSFAASVIENQRQKQVEEKRVYAANLDENTSGIEQSRNPADRMVTWTQQLQEQLKTKSTRQTSATSTQQLIETNSDK